MTEYEIERMESHLATPGEAVREWAMNVGGNRPGQAWLVSNYDTWERNPYYTGPDVPHPEYDGGSDEYDGAMPEYLPVVIVSDGDIPF